MERIEVDAKNHVLKITVERLEGTPFYCADAKCSCGRVFGINNAIGSRRKAVYMQWKRANSEHNFKFPWPLS